MKINFEDFLIIKTTEERIKKVGSLYDATHYRWKAKIENLEKYHYVLAVIKGYVKDVFVVDYWQPAKNRYGENGEGRCEFVGQLAPDEIRKYFIGKRIPEIYRKQGMANPVLFPKKEAHWD